MRFCHRHGRSGRKQFDLRSDSVLSYQAWPIPVYLMYTRPALRVTCRSLRARSDVRHQLASKPLDGLSIVGLNSDSQNGFFDSFRMMSIFLVRADDTANRLDNRVSRRETSVANTLQHE